MCVTVVCKVNFKHQPRHHYPSIEKPVLNTIHETRYCFQLSLQNLQIQTKVGIRHRLGCVNILHRIS